jgi:hypothetical protein
MLPVNEQPFESALMQTVRACNPFRIRFDANRYSVPAEYASQRLQLHAYPDRLCVYADGQLIARHRRGYDRHQDIEDPEHPKALLAQRHHAREQKLLARFLTLSPQAELYYHKLAERRRKARHPVHQLVALREIYGQEAVARAREDALHVAAFSSEYIANLLQSRARHCPDTSTPWHVPRAGDALEIELAEPDLSLYDPTAEDPS